ncbi:MAG: hypothetical protein IID54_08070 [Proteobacteria bacterium]|nr:hypothetical protein [Pseudomonadota bacterium]
MFGFLKIMRHEEQTGRVPEWCEGIEPEAHARWCFDPGTVLLISRIATIAGAGIAAIGSIRQGQAAQQQANLQAQILQQQADRDRLDAAAKEEDFRRSQSRALAKRRAGLGATGVEPASGSPLLVSEDFAGEVELQALRIRSGGELRATRAEQQAVLQRFKGRAARTSGFTRGGALLLTGAGKTFS